MPKLLMCINDDSKQHQRKYKGGKCSIVQPEGGNAFLHPSPFQVIHNVSVVHLSNISFLSITDLV